MKLVFCPIAHHYCMELPFIEYSNLKQWWSMGYASLLTLSFIYAYIISDKPYMCFK